MPYQVLARKWRPQTFAEVVGQEHISRTLRNAIVQNRIGHAYLFVGSRGIGKTTSARIFAKALNCSNNVDGEPCCRCQSCEEVAGGSSLDVIEIDGASHNRVEHIRDIRDNVQYLPVHGKYKIYIIDEVHMLTTQAWNALLKTLEEPPPHVKFIFATTEPHKVLPTIVSRCQRFDLKRISVPLIVQRLRQIADGEKISVEDAALAAIARAADGGMRDAQSILDQMIAFCGGLKADEMIREQDVIEVFGLVSGIELRELAAALFTNDLNRGLQVLQELAENGRDLERLFADLIGYVRNIMVTALCSNPQSLLEVSDSELADLGAIGKALDPQLVQRILQGLVAQEWSFRAALNKRIYLEAVLARVMLDAHSVQIDDIMTQLNLISGALPPEQMPPPRPTVVIPPPQVTVTKVIRQETTAPAAARPATSAATETTTPVAAPGPSPAIPEASGTAAPEQAEASPAPLAVCDKTENAASTDDEDAAPTEEAAPAIFDADSDTAALAAAPETEAAPADDEDEPAALAAPQDILSTDSINELLAQAALSEDDGMASDEVLDDMALADTRETLLHAAANESKNDPGRLLQALAEQTAQIAPDSELVDIVKELAPVSYRAGILLLAYDRRNMTQHRVRVLQDATSLKTLNRAFQTVQPRGRIEITAQLPREDEDAKAGLRRCTLEEREALAQQPIVKDFNQIFGSNIIDARIRESK